jgi:hypothetical protein
MTTLFSLAVRTRLGHFGRPKVGHSKGKIAANITNLANGRRFASVQELNLAIASDWARVRRVAGATQ